MGQKEEMHQSLAKMAAEQGFNERGQRFYANTLMRLSRPGTGIDIYLEDFPGERRRVSLMVRAKGRTILSLLPGDVDSLIHEVAELKEIRNYGDSNRDIDIEIDHCRALHAQRKTHQKFGCPLNWVDEVERDLRETRREIEALMGQEQPSGGRKIPF